MKYTLINLAAIVLGIAAITISALWVDNETIMAAGAFLVGYGIKRMGDKSPEKSTKAMHALILAAALPLVSCTGCAWLKSATPTINDVAKTMCARHFERQGFDFEQAAETLCKARKVLDPFLAHAQQAEVIAGAKADEAIGKTK